MQANSSSVQKLILPAIALIVVSFAPSQLSATRDPVFQQTDGTIKNIPAGGARPGCAAVLVYKT